MPEYLPEQNIGKSDKTKLPLLESAEELPLAFRFDDLATAEAYLCWKKQVPPELRAITESAMKKTASEQKPTGLPLVDQFLTEYEKRLRGEGFSEEKKRVISDPKIEKAFDLLKNIQTSEGNLDIFKAMADPNTLWQSKNELYQTQIEPILSWLAEESLKKEIEEKTKETEKEANDGDLGKESKQKDDSDIPPTTDEAASSMEHGVEKSGERDKPYFSIRSFWGGYYRQHVYDQFDLPVGRWKKKEKNIFKTTEPVTFEDTQKRVMFGKIKGEENPLAIPLPYGWAVDADSIKTNAPNGSWALKQNEDGAYYLGIRKKGIFHYQLIIGREKTARGISKEAKAEIGGALPEELQQKITDLKNSNLQPMVLTRAITRFVRDHLEYSNDPQAYKKYISLPQKYFESVWREKKADCYVSNTMAVRGLVEAGLFARFVGGFFCKEKNEDGSATLGVSNGHAWLEVWDNIGRKWTRMDATPKGDPNMDEEQQEQELSDDNDEGDYGENEGEIASEEDIKKKIEELKKKQQATGKKSEKSLEDLENSRFAEEAGCTEHQAKEFLKALERVREIKNEQGIAITDLLKEQWRRIVEENIVETPTYKGPVRMKEGQVLEDVVDAYIDISAGETNPTGYEKEFQLPQIKKEFGGINLYFSFDLSGSMSETDPVSGRAKVDVQTDAALLFIDSIMQCAIISRRQSGGSENVLPIKLMATLASSSAIPVLPLTDKWGPKEQWNFYSGLKKLASGGTPTHQTLELIGRAHEQEISDLKKRHIATDKHPLEYVVEMTDGAPDNVSATIAMHQKLKDDKIVVRSLVIGGMPIDETGMYDESGNPLQSFSQIPQILAKDIVEQFQKLKPQNLT